MKNVVLLLFLTIAFGAWSQEQSHSVSIPDYHMETRIMNADISTQAIDFEGAYLDDNFGLLPVYIHRFPLSSSDVALTAEIKEAHVGVFEDNRLVELMDAGLIQTQFILKTSVTYQEGRPFGEILLLPFRNIQNAHV